jgi:cell division topological specificity factor
MLFGLFGKKTTAPTVSERLQMVLIQDRQSVAPELMQNLKRDILEVIDRYVIIEREHIDVNLTVSNKVTTLIATVPIKNVRRTVKKSKL